MKSITGIHRIAYTIALLCSVPHAPIRAYWFDQGRPLYTATHTTSIAALDTIACKVAAICVVGSVISTVGYHLYKHLSQLEKAAELKKIEDTKKNNEKLSQLKNRYYSFVDLTIQNGADIPCILATLNLSSTLIHTICCTENKDFFQPGTIILIHYNEDRTFQALTLFKNHKRSITYERRQKPQKPLSKKEARATSPNSTCKEPQKPLSEEVGVTSLNKSILTTTITTINAWIAELKEIYKGSNPQLNFTTIERLEPINPEDLPKLNSFKIKQLRKGLKFFFHPDNLSKIETDNRDDIFKIIDSTIDTLQRYCP